MDDLVSEYGFVTLVVIIGIGVVEGLSNLLSAIWSGGMFL